MGNDRSRRSRFSPCPSPGNSRPTAPCLAISGRRRWSGSSRRAPRRGPPTAKPDLSGVWGYAGYTSDIAKDYDVGEVPMTPLGERLFKERQTDEGIYDPEARCQPAGVPRRDPYPSKIIQEPKLVVILFEGSMHSYRQIFLDRTTHPKDPQPTWFGD